MCAKIERTYAYQVCTHVRSVKKLFHWKEEILQFFSNGWSNQKQNSVELTVKNYKQTKKEEEKNAETRIRTWVTAATTQCPNH